MKLFMHQNYQPVIKINRTEILKTLSGHRAELVFSGLSV